VPIPRIIHQTSASGAAPPWAVQLRARIAELHPGWEQRMYDDAACRELVRRELPYLLPVYDAYAAPIQRVDMFRVVAVWAAGGFYLDLDVACERALDSLCALRLVLAEESTLTAAETARLGHEHALRVANYMFGAQPRHPFWLDVLDEMLARADRPVTRDEDVLESTGPGMLTAVYHRGAVNDPGVTLLRNGTHRCARCGGISCRFGAFAAHLHAGSWRGIAAALPRAQRAHTANANAAAARARALLATHLEPAPSGAEPLVLRTYAGDVHDGLSSVFANVRRLGTVVDDTRGAAGRRVLVAGIPFMYAKQLSPRNVNVAYTTFESTRLPDHWVAAINAHYRACAVPHAAIARVFRDSGVRVPLHVVPQGFTRYPRAPRGAPQNAFRVGFLGVPVRRKNLRTLYEACLRLHPVIPSLRLAVHVARWYEWLDRSVWRDVAAAPFVEWSEGVRSPGEVAAWYASLSCYAYPSSAEGWSFTPRESMYLGVPTVVSAVPVHDELAGSGFCTVIPAGRPEPAAFEGGVFGEWNAVETDDVVRALAEVHGNPAAAEEMARDGARWIEQRWLDDETLLALREVVASA
jgi:glycosyltransferase involved in cell wall biosynthesis